MTVILAAAAVVMQLLVGVRENFSLWAVVAPFLFITLPVIDNCLMRQWYALPQARTSSVEERQSNVANAFICRDHRLQDKQVLLIDDVTTSGATLNACASALKAAGATSVWGLVLAMEI